MNDNKRNAHGAFGKGYYIALILCAAAIGISGYLYYRNVNVPEPVLSGQDETLPAVNAGPDDIPAVATQPVGAEATVGDRQTPTAPVRRAIKTTAPVSGETVVPYAMDCLSYNETTRDWRVHNGIDIAADAGTAVVAAADGVVYTAYEDDSMGMTVVIRHDGGYTTQYSSLAKDLSVSAGDTVTMGQVIGHVGTTALVETTLGDHVHFSVTYQDVEMDPAEFFALN